MLPLMSKGPKSQRDEAKAAFEARLCALQEQHANCLHDAIASSTALPLKADEESMLLPDFEQEPRSVRVACKKRERMSQKRADYMSRRIYKEMRRICTSQCSDFSSAVKMIENSRPNVQLPVENSRTLLLAAADMGADAVIVSLLGAGAKVDAKDEQQRCALVIAAARNNSACVDAILDNSKFSAGNREELQRCMLLAISFGNKRIAQSLLLHIQKRKYVAQFLDWSLIAAATAAAADVLQLLLQRGASANAVDSLKRSALMLAISSQVARFNHERKATR
jgi:hypothetical protein